MEKLLILGWGQNTKNVQRGLMTIQAKTRSIFGDVKLKFSDPEETFMARNGWLHRFKADTNFHNVKMCSEAVNADIKAAETNLEILRKITDDGRTAHLIYNADETGLIWRNKCLIEPTFLK